MLNYNEIISQVRLKINEAEELGKTNSQQFLDFLDKLNELSVSY